MNTFLFILLASVSADAPDALAQDKLVSEVDFGRRVVESEEKSPTNSEARSPAKPDDTKELLAETVSIGGIAAASVLASSAIMAAGILVYTSVGAMSGKPQNGALVLGAFGATVVLPPLFAIGAMFLLTKPTVSAGIGTLAGYATGLVVGVTIGIANMFIGFIAFSSLGTVGSSSGGAIAGVMVLGAVATPIFLSASLGAALGAMSGHTTQRTFLE